MAEEATQISVLDIEALVPLATLTMHILAGSNLEGQNQTFRSIASNIEVNCHIERQTCSLGKAFTGN